MNVRARFDDLVSNTAFELEGLVEVLAALEVTEVTGVLERAENAASAGLHVAGFVAYDAAPAFDSALVVRAGAEPTLPLAWFAIFSRRRDVDIVKAPDHVAETRWQHASDIDSHRDAVERIKEQIRLGWTYQVNFAERLHVALDEAPFELYRQLATAQRGAYNAFLETETWAVASASPECFIEMARGVISSVPMKGTARRGRFADEDRVIAETLRTSAKERAENVMIVDLVRNDLGRVAAFGSVVVTDLLELERYPTVWQLTSKISARLGPGVGLVEAFRALFPCGSVTGAPKSSTTRIISELERSPRGLYCGAIGTVLPSAEGPEARFAVAIRTATIDRVRNLATYGVGGGITYDSDPSAEWAELEAKAEVLTFPPSVAGLFETFRYDSAVGFVNLERHLRRLGASAAFLGISYDALAAEELLASAVELPSPGRIRLSLARSGELFFESAPLVDDSPATLSLVIDDVAVDARDARLFHKTTDRDRYEEALRRHPGIDDVILQNADGHVTETTRANLAVLIDGEWCTPALGCGLLPGIERERLLEQGLLVERVITKEMCERATALATLSSLRGWRDAVLVRA